MKPIATGTALQEIEGELVRRGLGAPALPPDRSQQQSAAVPTLVVLLDDIATLTGIHEKVPLGEVYGLLPTEYGDAVDLLVWISQARSYAETHAGKNMARIARVLADVDREMPANEPVYSAQTLTDLAEAHISAVDRPLAISCSTLRSLAFALCTSPGACGGIVTGMALVTGARA
jgi:hypothetical protein